MISGNSDSLKENFEAAAAASKQLKEKPSDENLLKLYSLYKQAVKGDAGKKVAMACLT